jgi:hypothetical protein
MRASSWLINGVFIISEVGMLLTRCKLFVLFLISRSNFTISDRLSSLKVTSFEFRLGLSKSRRLTSTFLGDSAAAVVGFPIAGATLKGNSEYGETALGVG